MHDHDRGGQRPIDRRIESDDEQDQDQEQEWFKCALCGARYRSKRTAMQCCAGCFDDADHDPRSPPVAMTDGGHSASGSEQFGDIGDDLLAALVAGKLVKKVTIGTGYFDPVYPYHGAIRQCPFCGDLYRRHGGHADHRDKCEAGPSPGSNPMRPPGGGSA